MYKLNKHCTAKQIIDASYPFLSYITYSQLVHSTALLAVADEITLIPGTTLGCSKC